MKAAVTTAAGGFDVVEMPDPTPAADQLVLRVTACGVCGSDIKAYPFMPAGTVMGHEIGGEVVAVGAQARAAGWKPGVHVAVLPIVSCEDCAACRRGDVAHCSAVRFIGMGSDAGGFAELAVIPAIHAFPVPAGLPETASALVEPFAVGLHVAAAAEIGAGDRVVIVGAGGVGLTTLAWARAAGAERITVVDPSGTRRAAAQALGATDVLAAITDADSDGYDALVECVGRPELIEACLAAARPRGRIAIAGACSETFRVEPISGLLKELSIRFSVAYRPSDFRSVIDAFATGLIDPARVVGQVLALDRVTDAFELVRTAASDGRVLVAPPH